MKRNIIAILLSISLIAGLFGAAPLYAAEVTAQEAVTIRIRSAPWPRPSTAEGATAAW